jgi:hypothetical protein
MSKLTFSKLPNLRDPILFKLSLILSLRSILILSFHPRIGFLEWSHSFRLLNQDFVRIIPPMRATCPANLNHIFTPATYHSLSILSHSR